VSKSGNVAPDFEIGLSGGRVSTETLPSVIGRKHCEYNLLAGMRTPPKPTFRQKLWSSLEPVLMILVRDIIFFLIVLAALVLGFVGVAGLKALGMPPERVQVLETMHFYAYLAVAFVFLVDMVGKIILEILRKRT